MAVEKAAGIQRVGKGSSAGWEISLFFSSMGGQGRAGHARHTLDELGFRA